MKTSLQWRGMPGSGGVRIPILKSGIKGIHVYWLLSSLRPVSPFISQNAESQAFIFQEGYREDQVKEKHKTLNTS